MFSYDFLHIQDDKNTSPVTGKYTMTPPKNVALFADLKNQFCNHFPYI